MGFITEKHSYIAIYKHTTGKHSHIAILLKDNQQAVSKLFSGLRSGHLSPSDDNPSLNRLAITTYFSKL